MEWLMIALGGGLGATLRYSVMQIIKTIHLDSYWATAIVNIVGSYFLGMVSHSAIFTGSILSFVTIGTLGAFTTFSTFAFDIVKLLEKSRIMALCFVLLNLVGGLLFFVMGWAVV